MKGVSEGMGGVGLFIATDANAIGGVTNLTGIEVHSPGLRDQDNK